VGPKNTSTDPSGFMTRGRNSGVRRGGTAEVTPDLDPQRVPPDYPLVEASPARGSARTGPALPTDGPENDGRLAGMVGRSTSPLTREDRLMIEINSSKLRPTALNQVPLPD
jgi:hypothetical protein